MYLEALVMMIWMVVTAVVVMIANNPGNVTEHYPTHGCGPLYQWTSPFPLFDLRFSWGGYSNTVWFRSPVYNNSYTRILFGFSFKRYRKLATHISFRKATITILPKERR